MTQRVEVPTGSSTAVERRHDLALLLIRVVLGVVFIAHGAHKLFGAFGSLVWSGRPGPGRD
jgi:uncharacterized membrane protein YphA (DoxX/SURF4 family)